MRKLLIFLLFLTALPFVSFSEDGDIFDMYERKTYSGAIRISFTSSGLDSVEYRNCQSSLPIVVINLIDSYGQELPVFSGSNVFYKYRMDYILVGAKRGDNIDILQFCNASDRQNYFNDRWNSYSKSKLFGEDLVRISNMVNRNTYKGGHDGL